MPGDPVSTIQLVPIAYLSPRVFPQHQLPLCDRSLRCGTCTPLVLCGDLLQANFLPSEALGR
jgi:hypothetical protein